MEWTEDIYSESELREKGIRGPTGKDGFQFFNMGFIDQNQAEIENAAAEYYYYIRIPQFFIDALKFLGERPNPYSLASRYGLLHESLQQMSMIIVYLQQKVFNDGLLRIVVNQETYIIYSPDGVKKICELTQDKINTAFLRTKLYHKVFDQDLKLISNYLPPINYLPQKIKSDDPKKMENFAERILNNLNSSDTYIYTTESFELLSDAAEIFEMLKAQKLETVCQQMPSFFGRYFRFFYRPFDLELIKKRPNAIRGEKTAKGASDGGKRRNEENGFYVTQQEIKTEAARFVAKHSTYQSRQSAAKKIAEKIGCSYKTVERVAKEILAPYKRPINK